jgi:hypothetical protein
MDAFLHGFKLDLEQLEQYQTKWCMNIRYGCLHIKTGLVSHTVW